MGIFPACILHIAVSAADKTANSKSAAIKSFIYCMHLELISGLSYISMMHALMEQTNAQILHTAESFLRS
jgi:hypothetical protein